MHQTRQDQVEEHVLGAARVRVLVSGAATNGVYEIIEFRGEPGGLGPPAHVHRRASEAFIVLEGAIDLTVGDRTVHAGAGATMHVAPGEAHRFEYAAPGTRFLAMLTPATGFDAYIAGLGDLVREGGGTPDAARREALMARHDAFPG